MGGLVLAAAVVAPAVDYLNAAMVLRRFTPEGIALAPAFRVSSQAILGGLLALVLARVFREGARIAEEQSLTV